MMKRLELSMLVVLLWACLWTSLHAWTTSRLLPSSTRLYMQATDAKCGPCVNAPKCSGGFRDKGCDGNGKIQGGIATFPLFSWWPIKVYRPCPAYLQAGYAYQREGQTMDQVLFSEPSTKMKQKMESMKSSNTLDAKIARYFPKEPVAAAKEALKDTESESEDNTATVNGTSGEKSANDLLEEKFGNKK